MQSGGRGSSFAFGDEQELHILASRRCLCTYVRDAWMRWWAVGAAGARARDCEMACTFTRRSGVPERVHFSCWN
jgi:hypothetical protein